MTMTICAPGDRVRLIPKTADAFDRPHSPKAKVTWRQREGTISRIGYYTHDAYVKWDDRRTIDQWPLRALEKITKCSGKTNGAAKSRSRGR